MAVYKHPTKTGYERSNLNDVLKDLKVKIYFDSPLSGVCRSYFSKRKPGNTFSVDGKSHIYFRHYYNALWNERTVEIPVVWDEVKKRKGGRILEVGNVLPNYFRFKHDIVDKFEQGPWIINCDITDFKPKVKYDFIVSISTLEHIGWDEEPRALGKTLPAAKKLLSLRAQGGSVLVTMPLGHNTEMDGLIESGELEFDKKIFLKRVSEDNKWRQASWDEVKGARYGEPYMHGNAVIIGFLK